MLHVLTIASTWSGTPLSPNHQATVGFQQSPRGLSIQVEAPFHDDPPPARGLGLHPRLWEHEVVELFLAGAQGAYTELELGPWGHQLCLRFSAPREESDRGAWLQWTYLVRRGDRWRAAALLPTRFLPRPPWRANAFAIHGSDNHRQYCLAHPLPGDTPDFHQPDHFPSVP